MKSRSVRRIAALKKHIAELESQRKQAVKCLTSIANDCAMALAGTWDKGDDGFSAMLDSVERTLAALGTKAL